MNNKRYEAYRLLLEISDQLRNSSYERKIVEERFIQRDFHRNKTGHTSAAVKDLDWTNIAHDCMQDISDPTLVFIFKNIIPKVKHFNLLWHWPTPTLKSQKNALKELIDKGILFRTETVGIYLVNPIKIWRGNSITCVEATKQLLREKGKPCIELIRDLRPGDVYINGSAKDEFRRLLGSEGLPNLLKEDDAPYGQGD